MFEWYYTRNKQQQGPVDSRQLKALATSGELLPTDLVWKDGLAEWVPASTLKSMWESAPADEPVAPAPSATAPIPRAAPSQPPPKSDPVPYYSATPELPPEIAAILKGFPPLPGSRDEWPLTPDQHQQLAQAALLRLPIRRAAALYTALGYLGAFTGVYLLVIFVDFSSRVSGISPNRGTGLNPDFAGGALLAVLLILGLAALCFVAGRATRRCQLWAPIAMVVLFVLWIGLAIYTFVSSYREMRGTTPELVVFSLFSLIPPGVFLIMSVNALTHLKPFLRRPRWTIHLLVATKA